MKVCIITSIFHGFGKIGGFGVMARELAKGLAAQGHDVIVVVPRKKGQAHKTEMEDYTVLGVNLVDMINPLVYRRINADVYHSQSPNLMSTAAMIARPKAVHIITCRDPRDMKDWHIEIRDATFKRKLKNYGLMLFEEGPLVRWTIRHADATAYVAKFIKEKIKTMYGVEQEPYHLSNIQRVPSSIPKKSIHARVIFVGRLDKRKRPELYFELAKKFPEVEFVVMGAAESASRQEQFVEEAKEIDNIQMLGFIDKFDDHKKFNNEIGKSWILINTASREAFPLTFFEAGSKGCAILSHVNPDNIIPDIGYWAENDSDFETGLHYLLQRNRWKAKGKKAQDYFREETHQSLKEHVQLYKKLIKEKKA